MHVAYLLSRYPLLSETFILREMEALEQRGHRLQVLALRQVRRGLRHPRTSRLQAPVLRLPWLALGAHAYWLRRRPGRYFSTFFLSLWYNRGDRNLLLAACAYWGKALRAAQAAHTTGVNHLHAHYATHPAWVAWVSHRLTGIPYSFTVHAHDLFCHRAMLPEKIRAAAWVATISQFNRERLEALRPRGVATPIPVVRCGVESARYRGRLALAPAPATSAPLRLLSVGSLQPYKGHDVLVRACARLHAAGASFHCRIVGGGPRRRPLARAIARHHLQALVELTGPADEDRVRAELAASDVFVLPSIVDPRTGQMEGIPVALMEAMAAGCAVVASRLSGIPELVADGATGLLVPPGDDRALAAALLRLHSPALRHRLATAARRHVAAEYELATNVDRLAAWLTGPPHTAVEARA